MNKNRSGKKLHYLCRHLLVALHALLLIWICYIAGNLPYSFGSEKQTVKWLNAISGWITNKSYSCPDELLPINVFYDKQLISVADEYGLPIGVIDITDRTSLHRILHLIDSVGTYRYVVCDILFRQEYHTTTDSALFNLIATMPNIVVAGGNDITQLPELIRPKASLSSYNITINDGDFVKYPLFTKGEESLPLRMYRELYGKAVSGNSFFCHGEGRMCKRSVFLDFPVRISQLYAGEQRHPWLNLGSDILQVESMLNLEELFKDKIILLGSYIEDDIHSTIAGEMPGIIINYNAFHDLENGKQYVKFFALLILFVVFYLITLLVVDRREWEELLPQRFYPKSHVAQMLLSLISFSMIFTLVFLILYLIFREVYDIFFIATYFTILKTIRNFYA